MLITVTIVADTFIILEEFTRVSRLIKLVLVKLVDVDIVGDRVAIEPGVPCRRCDFCKKGKYNLCPDVEFLATPPVHGDLTRFHVHAADFCFK